MLQPIEYSEMACSKAKSLDRGRHTERLMRCERFVLYPFFDGFALNVRNDKQPFEYRSVSYGSKEINGTLPGGRKK